MWGFYAPPAHKMAMTRRRQHHSLFIFISTFIYLFISLKHPDLTRHTRSAPVRAENPTPDVRPAVLPAMVNGYTRKKKTLFYIMYKDASTRVNSKALLVINVLTICHMQTYRSATELSYKALWAGIMPFAALPGSRFQIYHRLISNRTRFVAISI